MGRRADRGGSCVRQVVIENPVINSAFAEPQRHFRFDAEGITDEIVEARRLSAYFVPIAQPKKRASSSSDTEDQDRVEEQVHQRRSRTRGRLAGCRLLGHTHLRACSITGRAPIASAASSSASSRRCRRPSSSPRSPPRPALAGSTTTCARKTSVPIRACSASPSRWPRGPARRWSWPAHRLAGAQQVRQSAGRRFGDTF